MNLGFDSFGSEQLAGLGGTGGGGGGGGGKAASSASSATSGNAFNFGGGADSGGGLTPLALVVLVAVAVFGFLGLVLIAKK
jgi:hypothetical protein